MARGFTQTQATHYEVQKKRREGTLEEWKKHRREVIKADDYTMYDTPRRVRRGVQLSADGDRPTVVLDANRHEIPPETTSTIHRHSWDALMFITEGEGWTEIDGRRLHWRAWDTVHLPSWAWHRHGNTAGRPAKYVTWSVQPMFELLNSAIIEDAGDTPYGELPPAPRQSLALDGDDPYSRRVRRLAEAYESPEDVRRMTEWDDIKFRITPRGARSGFLVDPSLGYRTTGLTAVCHQLGPGLYQSRHRHGGEAWLYVITGHGHSEIDGVDYEWGPGDLVVVDRWAWHQHFNDDNERIASLIRIHNMDTLYMGMRIMLDPLDLFEEPPKLDAPPNVHDIDWPPTDQGRPL